MIENIPYKIYNHSSRDKPRIKLMIAQGYHPSMGITESEFNHIKDTIDLPVTQYHKRHNQIIYDKIINNNCIPPGWRQEPIAPTGMTLEWAKDTFDVNPDTGIVTYKKIRQMKLVNGKLFRDLHTLQSGGYIFTTVRDENNKTHCILAHRIAYMLYHNTDIPKNMVIDHIDQNRTNNKKDNLRLVTRSSNARNRKLNRNNTSGYRNIAWCPKSKNWRVALIYETKPYVNEFKNFDDALEHRNKMITKLWGKEYLQEIEERDTLDTGEKYIYVMNNDPVNPYYFINAWGKTAACRNLDEAIQIRDQFLQEIEESKLNS